MTKALYRKYRPKNLKEVIGQEQVTKPLLASLKQGKISHAYLFIGPRGTGKTSVARILAHEVNGFSYELEDDYVDIIEIDGASNRGIDNIRELREKAAIAPTKGKYKIYIIDEVHMLTKEAFNALLKTLEEPPAHVIFILATTDAYKVPVTITSRAQTYTFKLADQKLMFDYLKTIAEKEKIQIDDEALKIVAKRGGGSFRDSLSLLDQISTLSNDKITKGMVVTALGLPQDEKIHELLDSYLSGDASRNVAVIKELLSSGIKAETLAEELISTIIDEPKPELLQLLEKLPEVRAPFAEAKLLVALSQSAPCVSDSGPRPAGPSPRAAGANSRAAALRNAPSSDTHDAVSNNTNLKDFNWDGFLDKVKSANDAVYAQLLKTRYEFIDNSLELYPEKRIVKTILSRDNNKRILVEALGNNVKITIHDIDETPKTAVKDTVLSKISDIMGGEVKNDGGGNPFEA
jgi:DNA polymerase-3 subunit gamma/tau